MLREATPQQDSRLNTSLPPNTMGSCHAVLPLHPKGSNLQEATKSTSTFHTKSIARSQALPLSYPWLVALSLTKPKTLPLILSPLNAKIHPTQDPPIDVPPIVQTFFDHDRAVNHDGHHMSLLTIQFTELIDAVFIGCSMNHALADGTSYWKFFNAWSDIFQSQSQLKGKEEDFDFANIISHKPINKRWFPKGCDPIINLPFKHADEFVCRFEASKLRERIFHLGAESIAKLKAKANKESNTNKISSFQ
ncbi:hypothetical protein PIB30_032810 [Stylosanthes scabra]|uniref:Uncharacterized protein n=1 Tax=Stylosanthes scabra TaxID=79078 RepID=A0ABU6XDS6_9FABA|nr:hypothetical protein [Stylosanthes scabra]